MSTHYTAGGMPLAFTQEDFLVSLYNQQTEIYARLMLESYQSIINVDHFCISIHVFFKYFMKAYRRK